MTMPSVSTPFVFLVLLCIHRHQFSSGLAAPRFGLSRRGWLQETTLRTIVGSSSSLVLWHAGDVSALAIGDTGSVAQSISTELPPDIRQYTALAPLGDPKTKIGGDKVIDLSLEELAKRLSNDLVYGKAGKGGYFISGDLSPELFRDDCLFIDPTNTVNSLSRYRNALNILFDPAASQVEIVDPLTSDPSNRTIKGRIRSSGRLQLPWRPFIAPYESDIVYTIDESGLVAQQYQTWDISAATALRESFTPGPLFPDPPRSTLPKPVDEPKEVTRLFDLVNGRRPFREYYPNDEDRREIDSLINDIVSKRYPWKRDKLTGLWTLAYLQPGPEGATVDRRIPFPDFPFNDSYQRFTDQSGSNIGQVLGPIVEVRVSGSLREEDSSTIDTPKRFVANINEGLLCFGAGRRNDRRSDGCIPLPISGEGLFDGVFVGERLRIGQNLNGGGARVVQVKVDHQ